MNPGALNRRVEVQRKVETRDEQGGVVVEWKTRTTRWASIEPMRGEELTQAAQRQARATVIVRLRYGVDVLPKDRFRVRQTPLRLLNVESVIEDRGRAHMLTCQCIEET